MPIRKLVVAMVADGMTAEQVLADLPDLEPEDVSEALRYASETVRERELAQPTPSRFRFLLDNNSSIRLEALLANAGHDISALLSLRDHVIVPSSPAFGTLRGFQNPKSSPRSTATTRR
jgi:hypothetical protein